MFSLTIAKGVITKFPLTYYTYSSLLLGLEMGKYIFPHTWLKETAE